jgi:hypothetical protein
LRLEELVGGHVVGMQTAPTLACSTTKKGKSESVPSDVNDALARSLKGSMWENAVGMKTSPMLTCMHERRLTL